MRKFLSRLGAASRQAGFTMVELLVVIAIIGILAVAVLSTLNPIEQINKSRDTRTRNDVVQVMTAIERYYATQEDYPWANTVSATKVPSDQVYPLILLSDGDASEWVQFLEDVGEVKQVMVDRVTDAASTISVFKEAGVNGQVIGCFDPISSAFEAEADAACADAGSSASLTGTTEACQTTDGSNNEGNMVCLP